MSSFGDIEISRKTSVILNLNKNYEEKRKSSVLSDKGREPNDSFFLIHILCLFMGFMNIMPMMFFSTAQSYWMYKFRNTTIDSETTKGTDRTFLQSYYTSSTQAASTVPTVLITITLTLYGHKLSAMIRSIFSIAGLFLLFVVFTIFTQVDTDSWQTGFFILTFLLMILNSVLTATFQMSSVVLLAKLHHKFMFFFLLGQNGTFLTTTLQVVSLALTDKSVTSGLIYFIAGTILIAISFVLLMLGRKSKMFKFYNVEDIQDKKSEQMSWSESKELLKQIWPCLVIMDVTILSLTCVHPSVSTLIVSQNDGDGSQWTKKYFTPVCTILLIEISSIIGRFSARGFLISHENKWIYLGVATIKSIAVVPLYIFCNAQPRHLPVLFDRDWEYLLIHAFNGWTVGFSFNLCFMSVNSLVKNKQEAAFKLLTLSMSLIMAACIANGIVMVKLL